MTKNSISNWNMIGKTKAVILLGIVILNLIYNDVNLVFNSFLAFIIKSFLALAWPAFIVPISVRLNKFIFNLKTEPSNWNHHLFSFKRALSFFQFMAYFFISVGISFLLTSILRYQNISAVGGSSIFFGVGILIGINRVEKKQELII